MFKRGLKKQFGKFSNTFTFAQIFYQYATLCCLLTLISENRLYYVLDT